MKVTDKDSEGRKDEQTKTEREREREREKEREREREKERKKQQKETIIGRDSRQTESVILARLKARGPALPTLLSAGEQVAGVDDRFQEHMRAVSEYLNFRKLPPEVVLPGPSRTACCIGICIHQFKFSLMARNECA